MQEDYGNTCKKIILIEFAGFFSRIFLRLGGCYHQHPHPQMPLAINLVAYNKSNNFHIFEELLNSIKIALKVA